jgi:TatA/E family protein of Tat protein translocase
MNFGAPELIILLVVVLVVFGGSQLPKLAKNLGKAQQEFKSGLAEGDLIISADGAPLTGLDDLLRVLGPGSIDRQIAFEVIRAGKRLVIKVTPKARKKHG